MRVVLLGTAAGGGFPQWNCACRLCVSARLGAPGVPARGQDGIAVSADDQEWYLFNASPDLPAQMRATPALDPGPGRRDTPIRGVLLTDAELDHTLGLMTLREAPRLRVWAADPVIGALSRTFPIRGVLDCYGGWDWQPVRAGERLAVPGLVVTACAVSGKRPRYAAGAAHADDWVISYRIEDPATGGVLVYAPCLARWPGAFDKLVAGASVVLLDGTFLAADELAEQTGRAAPPGPGANTPMGHLPITGPGGSLDRLRERTGVRWIYTHLNNTNALLDAGSAARGALTEAGAAVLDDGTELRL